MQAGLPQQGVKTCRGQQGPQEAIDQVDVRSKGRVTRGGAEQRLGHQQGVHGASRRAGNANPGPPAAGVKTSKRRHRPPGSTGWGGGLLCMWWWSLWCSRAIGVTSWTPRSYIAPWRQLKAERSWHELVRGQPCQRIQGPDDHQQPMSARVSASGRSPARASLTSRTSSPPKRSLSTSRKAEITRHRIKTRPADSGPQQGRVNAADAAQQGAGRDRDWQQGQTSMWTLGRKPTSSRISSRTTTSTEWTELERRQCACRCCPCRCWCCRLESARDCFVIRWVKCIDSLQPLVVLAACSACSACGSG